MAQDGDVVADAVGVTAIDGSAPMRRDNWDKHGWGYGVSVSTAPDAISSTPGRYGWDGGFGTSWINDPGRKLVGIVMTQSSDFLFSGAREAFWRGLHRAVE